MDRSRRQHVPHPRAIQAVRRRHREAGAEQEAGAARDAGDLHQHQRRPRQRRGGGPPARGRGAARGPVEAGRLADLALLDLDTLAFTPLNDLRRQLVYCEGGGSVRLTMVAGRVVFEGGRVATVNEEDLLREARELFAAAGGGVEAGKQQREQG